MGIRYEIYRSNRPRTPDGPFALRKYPVLWHSCNITALPSGNTQYLILHVRFSMIQIKNKRKN